MPVIPYEYSGSRDPPAANQYPNWTTHMPLQDISQVANVKLPRKEGLSDPEAETALFPIFSMHTRICHNWDQLGKFWAALVLGSCQGMSVRTPVPGGRAYIPQRWWQSTWYTPLRYLYHEPNRTRPEAPRLPKVIWQLLVGKELGQDVASALLLASRLLGHAEETGAV